MQILTIILAAGKGTRMKSELPKVLFPAAGKPMLDYVLDTAEMIESSSSVVIIGNAAEMVRTHVGERAECALQVQQRGTADAVLAARDQIAAHTGKVLVLCGDMPLVKAETLNAFIEAAAEHPVAFISVPVQNPFGYGRVVRGADGNVLKIVEEKDANPTEKKIREINTGIYLCDAAVLLDRLSRVGTNNAQGEYYLTDIVAEGAFAWAATDEIEFLGVNNRAQLAQAAKVLWRRTAEELMMSGVSILDPDHVYIGAGVEVETDVTIYPNVTLEGETVIGKGTVLYPGVRIVDSVIEADCEIKDNTLIDESFVGAESSVGPMAQLRPGTKLMGKNKLGNFVETKKAVLGIGTKASHLTYLGDIEAGADCNIGCGTITCNYDGVNKYKTTLGNDVFIGSDVQLVAPVTVGDGALVAAGSCITKDVPAGALGVTRAEQKNLEGWVARWKAKKQKEKKQDKE